MRWRILWMISLTSGWSSLWQPRLDVAQRADGAQKMLVDGVMMVHRELHHPHDAAEVGNEPAKHSGLVHPAERRFRRAARGQHFEKQPVRLGILAQRCVDALQRLGDEPGRVGMDRQVRPVGDPENSDQIDRVTLENVAGEHIDAVVLDLEVLGVGNRAGASLKPADETGRTPASASSGAPRARRRRSPSGRRHPWPPGNSVS